jgi:hypothetical protein
MAVYIESNDRIIKEFKIFGTKLWQPNLRHYPTICLEGLRKPTKHLIQDNFQIRSSSTGHLAVKPGQAMKITYTH